MSRPNKVFSRDIFSKAGLKFLQLVFAGHDYEQRYAWIALINSGLLFFTDLTLEETSKISIASEG